MTRKFFFFSEMGYNAYPLEALEQYGYSALLFPNSIFDRETARDLWQMFLREHEHASEMGFDGSVCNEHHNNVLSMQESVNISAAVISQRIKGTIALIGNPLPIHDNPVRVAEETAPADLGGRHLESGDDPLGGAAAHHLSRPGQRSRCHRHLPRHLPRGRARGWVG